MLLFLSNLYRIYTETKPKLNRRKTEAKANKYRNLTGT